MSGQNKKKESLPVSLVISDTERYYENLSCINYFAINISTLIPGQPW